MLAPGFAPVITRLSIHTFTQANYPRVHSVFLAAIDLAGSVRPEFNRMYMHNEALCQNMRLSTNCT
jgi:hypothetical protein